MKQHWQNVDNYLSCNRYMEVHYSTLTLLYSWFVIFHNGKCRKREGVKNSLLIPRHILNHSLFNLRQTVFCPHYSIETVLKKPPMTPMTTMNGIFLVYILSSLWNFRMLQFLFFLLAFY